MPPPGVKLSGRAKFLLIAAVLVLSLASWHRLVLAPLPGPLFEFSGATMGTTFLVKVSAENMTRDEHGSIAAAVTERLDAVNQLMSTWDETSELSRFNRFAGEGPFAVSADSIEVFVAARDVSRKSGGAFDVTVAPLVAAWGFGAGADAPGGPSPAELAALRERVGFEKVGIDAQAGHLVKLHPDVTCDLSAIAKGYAVDRVSDALARSGYPDHLVEVGGELRSGGVRPDGGPWRVAVESPAARASDGRVVHDVVALSDRAMATSGDYRSYYEQEGVRVSHTLDPRTGRPILHRLASVTVLHASAMYADAYATALNVLGPEAGLALAERLDLAAYFIIREKNGTFASRETARFATARELAKRPAERARAQLPE